MRNIAPSIVSARRTNRMNGFHCSSSKRFLPPNRFHSQRSKRKKSEAEEKKLLAETARAKTCSIIRRLLSGPGVVTPPERGHLLAEPGRKQESRKLAPDFDKIKTSRVERFP